MSTTFCCYLYIVGKVKREGMTSWHQWLVYLHPWYTKILVNVLKDFVQGSDDYFPPGCGAYIHKFPNIPWRKITIMILTYQGQTTNIGHNVTEGIPNVRQHSIYFIDVAHHRLCSCKDNLRGKQTCLAIAWNLDNINGGRSFMKGVKIESILINGTFTIILAKVRS